MAAPGELEHGVDLGQAVGEHVRLFKERYGGAQDVRGYFAPGRVNLMGAHLDYNGGPVMPLAIDRGTFVAIRPVSGSGGGRRLRIASTLDRHGLDLELSTELHPTGRWVDYPLGVVAEILETLDGLPADGAEILYGGNLPIGAGLSSSASICVGTALALDRVWGLGLEPMEIVNIALRAERGFVGVKCGIMDPYAVGLAREGCILWLDCKDTTCEHLPLDAGRLTVGVADTGVRRELAQGAFNERVDECGRAFDALGRFAEGATCLRDVPLEVLSAQHEALEPVVARRAKHVLEEVQRTFVARKALIDGRPEIFGEQMTRAHESLRELFEVSCDELDCLVESAASCPGVLGSRLTGAGFGGCAVVLLERGAEVELEAALGTAFERRFGKRPRVDFYSGGGGPVEIGPGA